MPKTTKTTLPQNQPDFSDAGRLRLQPSGTSAHWRGRWLLWLKKRRHLKTLDHPPVKP